MSERRQVSTRTETETVGGQKVTKVIREERVTHADGSETLTREETDGSKTVRTNTEKRGPAQCASTETAGLPQGRKSGLPSSGKEKTTPESMEEFRKSAVQTHNALRAKHGSPPLTHSAQLSEHAQKWAEHLSTSGVFQHSPCKLGEDVLGENIANKWSSAGADFSGKEVTEYWYSEVKDHDFQSETNPKSGHFSQVVWRASREVGLGKARTKDGRVFVVANYRPAGNFLGEMRQNVAPTSP